MDLRQLRAFVTVARFSSVTKAAEVLHVTQPAVSGQLRSLEEELQVKLLTRTTSSVSLTPTGQELLGLAEDALEAFGKFTHAARTRRGEIEGKLKIGVVMVEPKSLRLGPLLADLVLHSPGIAVDLQVARTSWMLDCLRNADIDAAILVAPTAPVGTHWLVLEKIRFRVAIPAGWSRRFKGTGLTELAEVPWVRMAQRSAHRDLMNELLRNSPIAPKETVEVDHELVMLELVSAGVGVGLLREKLAGPAAAAGELAFFGDHSVDVNLAFVYPEARASDPLVLEVIAALQRVWSITKVAQ